MLIETPKGVPVKTAVDIARPAYFDKATTALVHFSFRWSIHRADANYVLRKQPNGWQVACVDVIHYP